jgi:hypothetical protein
MEPLPEFAAVQLADQADLSRLEVRLVGQSACRP